MGWQDDAVVSNGWQADPVVGAKKPPQSATEKAIDPTEGMSTKEKLLAGAGKAFYDVGRGVGTLVTDSFPGAEKYGFATRKDVDEAKKLDAPLMNTKAGIAGNIGGSLALFAPTALLPGANAVTGGALIGAGLGAIQPVGTDDSRLNNMAMGGVVGGAVPAAVKGVKTVRAMLVDPFTSYGQSKIAGSLMNKAAANPSAVVDKLLSAKGETEGFLPSVGQASDDAGIASLERTARAIDPKGFDALDKSQRGALIDALKGVAKTPEDRNIASKAVEANAKKLYGEAFKENMEVTPELSRLALRPSMKNAEQRAVGLADELSIPFQARLKDMNPQHIPMDGAQVSKSSVISPTTRDSLGMAKSAEEITIPSQPQKSSYFEVPPVDSVPVRDMHTIKMGMDALMSDPTLGIAGRESAAINRTRNQLLDSMPESYQAARKSHIEMNKPVNQMDIGTELYKRFTPALADQGGLPFKSTAQSYANALRNGDELAKSVTGLKNAKMEEIMTPEQMQILNGVAKDSATKAAAETIGRGAGSNTMQHLAMGNLASEAGVPNFISSLAKAPGGWVKRAGDILYGNSDEQIRAKLADLLKNPQEAAQAMKAAGATPSQIAKFLMQGTQSLGFSSIPVLNSQK